MLWVEAVFAAVGTQFGLDDGVEFGLGVIGVVVLLAIMLMLSLIGGCMRFKAVALVSGL